MSKTRLFSYISFGILLFLAIISLQNYLVWDFKLLICLALLPLAFRPNAGFSARYLLISALFLGLYPFLHSEFLRFLGFSALLISLVEMYWGKLGLLPFLTTLTLSPALQYVISVFTFPIRLQLSYWAGAAFQLIGVPISVQGNYFQYPSGEIFTVDTACIGLNLMATGFAFVLMMVALFQNKLKKTLPTTILLGLLGITGFLLVLANGLRIVMLVLLHSLPHTLSHEVIGLASLFFYVFLPLFFLISKAFTGWGKEKEEVREHQPYSPAFLVLLLILGLGFYTFPQLFISSNPEDLKVKKLEIAGMKKEKMELEVQKFSDAKAWIYVKPAVPVWSSDHTPLMCWRASGFEFQKVESLKISEKEVLFSALTKGEEVIFTVWWYDNGEDKTISQLRWRSRIGAEPYRLINVSSRSKTDCLEYAARLLEARLF